MEVWKDVIGFEDSYQISTEGNLRSKDRYVKHWRGGIRMYKGNLIHSCQRIEQSKTSKDVRNQSYNSLEIKNELAYKHLWESNKLAA